ncbi:MAG: class I SAM-dependent methyltransferase [Bacteriovoracales bacterium]|nr:class I SAM-dependent methyltransferase [Bacteriovoracales bacterium]
MNLHLGCGKRYIPGFVHIDRAKYDHITHVCSFEKLPFIKSDTVDLIYCSHGIQYFDRFEIIPILKEWKRTLKPTGILRLAVPDFSVLSKLYDTEGLEKVIGPLFGRIQINEERGEEWIYHRTVYDFELLRSTLHSAGFKIVKRYDWKKTIHQDYDDCSQAYIPHMDKKNGTLISLNVEARIGSAHEF